MLLLRGLQETGHECTLLARERSALWMAARAANIETFSANAGSLWLRSKRADLVHAHEARGHAIAALASRQRFVVSRRVAFPISRSVASRWKYRRAKRFLAVSQFVAGELRMAGIPAEKIDVVYDAVEIEQDATRWDAKGPAVALGTTDPQKGRILTERAAHNAGIPVVFSTDLQGDLVNASMFIYITQSEGLGSAALLAMAMGVPVIASHVGGLTEVFEDRKSGLFVQNKPEEIARAMRTVRENPALAATLIAGGKQRVKEKFSKQRMLEATLRSYERALAG
jgi:glycosyltransferase involved in cell wall biosynthesis